jgi:phosphoribosylaminoimidazole (AIR) synthetase
MGIGMIMVAAPEDVQAITEQLQAQQEKVHIIGKIVSGARGVTIKGGIFDE